MESTKDLAPSPQGAKEADAPNPSLAITPPAQSVHIESGVPQPADQESQIEPDSTDENDSAFGDYEEGSSISTSIESSIRDYRVENGRTYHSYKDGQYAYPNDEAERDRLDLMHHLYRLLLDDKLHLSPIKDDVQDVLDIGTGTGIWAIDFADEHPSAHVIGTDLSPIQPSFVPPNLSFLVDDSNEEWVFRQKFDFIHARQLHCSVEEQKMTRQAYDNLKPGGWFELQDLTFPVGNDDNTLTKEHTVYQWSELMLEASRRIGQDLDKPSKYAQWMRDAGFTNVNQVLLKCPASAWPKEKKFKTLGMWHQANTLDGLEGFTMAFFTRILNWQPEEVHSFLVGVRGDTNNKRIHNYWPVWITYGQKPE